VAVISFEEVPSMSIPLHPAAYMSPKAVPFHQCDTCSKCDEKQRMCYVLTEMIGKRRECWAWDDDPAWERKAEAATSAYAKARGEKWEMRFVS
jgi:hypothetical protein